MEPSLLKHAAIQSLALMLAVITLSYGLQHYQTVTISASNITYNTEVVSDSVITPVVSDDKSSQELTDESQQYSKEGLSDLEQLLAEVDQELIKQLGNRFIVVQKPQGTKLLANLTDLYVKKSIRLTIEGMENNSINSNMISRVIDNELFQGIPNYTEIVNTLVDEEEGTTKEVITKDFGNDFGHGITITTNPDTTGVLYNADILIELDSVYAYKLYEDAHYYFIEMRKPSEVYDKIIVIDPGHGGKDVGAISKDDRHYEKNINLDIALHLKELLDKENIKVYYTRTSDETVYLRPRVELANTVDADYFISIHCNSNNSTGPNGLEVLYTDTDYKGVKSIDLAKVFSQKIHDLVTLKQRGVVQRHTEDIYIMNKAKVPMILIEVAYMSNRNDMDFLSLEDNRKAVAQGIYNGIMEAYEVLPVTK